MSFDWSKVVRVWQLTGLYTNRVLKKCVQTVSDVIVIGFWEPLWNERGAKKVNSISATTAENKFWFYLNSAVFSKVFLRKQIRYIFQFVSVNTVRNSKQIRHNLIKWFSFCKYWHFFTLLRNDMLNKWMCRTIVLNKSDVVIL